jgi:hypothetical protein
MKARIIFLLFLLIPYLSQAQTVKSFDGISATQTSPASFDADPNGAVGTKQYMEWVNSFYQAYDKTTFAPVWPVVKNGDTPWENNNVQNCFGLGGGDGIITFDRLASRWVMARRSTPPGGYYYCIAVSSTDDLSSATLTWHTYQIALNGILHTNSHGHTYWPDWPKFGTWPDAYYVSFNLQDPDNGFQNIGVVACALDRTNMLTGAAARGAQCFSDPSPIPTSGGLYLSHSLIPGDVDGTTAPPGGRHEYFVSIQNPKNDGKTKTSAALNLWDFSVNWTTPSLSIFKKSALTVASYTPGCYNAAMPVNTFCVPEPSSGTTKNYVDSVGDRMMPRMAYRNFASYESFVISQTVQVGAGANQQTGIRWLELRGSATPTVFQTGTLNSGTLYRFMPSIAQDKVGNAAAGYSASNSTTHPGIKASYWSLPGKTKPTEIVIKAGVGDEENSDLWGDYTSMTVDPVDGCTFWYVNEYFPTNQVGNSIDWNTRIANFKLSTCN